MGESDGGRSAEDEALDDGGAPAMATRREFLALSAAGVAAATLPVEAEAAPPTPPAVRGPGTTTIQLRVNGSTRRVEVEPGTTLAQALREGLGLTGTKIGCDRGACSACTVLLDGVPVSSCTTFALDVGDRAVTTIEGVATARGLTPLQEAFVAHDAMQCGFCSPGMVMSCLALLARNPRPTLEDVKQATSGNLCRCGTYPKVFEAVLAVAGTSASRR